MARSYDRETKHYDFKVLTHLVETGQATFFDGPGIYVIKTEDGTVAVRPHQVIFTPDPAPFTVVVEEKVPSPMDGYSGQEKYDGEDVGPGGVVYDSMLELAERWIATEGVPGMDPLYLVRRMLDDERYEATIRDQVANGQRVTERAAARRACSLGDEAEELLRHFGA